MEKYNYLESIKNDILEYIENEIDLMDFNTWEQVKIQLDENLWCEDSVTGNASGSYTFSTFQAEENICHNLDLLAEACEEFGIINPLKKGAEGADVVIRCYLLGQAISEIIEELKSSSTKLIEKLLETVEQ